METNPIINVNVQSNDTPHAQYKTVILKPNMVDDVNTLTQEMVSQGNTKYVIKYDFTLGEDITIPANCVLEFDGGSISGAYTLTGSNTGINAGLVKIFNTNVLFDGTWNVDTYYPEWFGAVGDGVTDDKNAFEKLNGKHITLQSKVYCISSITFGSKTQIYGNGRNKTVLKQKDNSSGDFITLLNWDYGRITNFTIQGGNDIEVVNYQQALVKVKTTNGQTSTNRSLIDNVFINASEANGISFLGYNDVDNGITCSYNWIYTVSNLFVENCGDYCIFNNSTDNLFININASAGGKADIYERGGSNMWNNLKLDGPSCSECIGMSLSDIMTSEDRGAALVIRGEGRSNFINLDVQSSYFLGVKIIGTRWCNIQGDINNCGLYVSQNLKDNVEGLHLYDEEDLDYTPGLYIKGVHSNFIQVNCNYFASQAQSFISDSANISTGNVLILNYEITERIGNYLYHFDLEQFKLYNTVIEGNSNEKHEIVRYLKNLHNSDYIGGSDNITVSDNDTEIFDTPCKTMTMDARNARANVNLYYSDGAFTRFIPGHTYICMFVVKILDFTKKDSVAYINKLPFVNVIEEVNGSWVGVKTNISDRYNRLKAKVGDVYLSAFAFEPTSYKGQVILDSTGETGRFKVANVKIYDATQDLGINMQLKESASGTGQYGIIEKILLNNQNLLNANQQFDDILVKFYSDKLFLTKDAGKSLCRTPIPNIGDYYFDTDLGKPIFASDIAMDGTITWVDATGTPV